MTDLDLDAIKKRADAATAGPWVWNITAQINMGRVWLPVGSSRDVKFIAHARTDVPALVAEVVRLRLDRDRVTEVVTEVVRRNGPVLDLPEKIVAALFGNPGPLNSQEATNG